MRLEKREYLIRHGTLSEPQEMGVKLLLIPNKEESKLIDEVLGSEVGEDGLIACVDGEVRLSDGYGEHYIVLKRK